MTSRVFIVVRWLVRLGVGIFMSVLFVGLSFCLYDFGHDSLRLFVKLD